MAYKVGLHVRLDPRMNDAVNAACEEKGLTRVDFFRQCLEMGLRSPHRLSGGCGCKKALIALKRRSQVNDNCIASETVQLCIQALDKELGEGG